MWSSAGALVRRGDFALRASRQLQQRQSASLPSRALQLYKSHGRTICCTVPVCTAQKHRHGYDASWERSHNRDNVFFTPGPLDPEKIDSHIPSHAKKLFTPGPLSVTKTTKEAMMMDVGPHDEKFIKCLKFIREEMIKIADLPKTAFTTVLLQGSGTYAMEGVLQTAIPRNNPKVLIIENGTYSTRMRTICEMAGFPVNALKYPENGAVDLNEVENYLQSNPDITNVAMVHHETSSGILNPVEKVGQLIRKHTPDACFYVDAMSSFGAVPIDMERGGIDFLTVSANKCIEGVPGFSFILANKEQLLKSEGNSRSLSFDLVSQYKSLEGKGTFRFTPATHTLLAFSQALKEFQEEGGVEGRGRRYKKNNKVLREGMRKMGFKEFLPEGLGSFLITTYRCPNHPNFDIDTFFNKLNEKDILLGHVLVGQIQTIQISTMGNVFPHDVRYLLRTIESVLHDMNVS